MADFGREKRINIRTGVSKKYLKEFFKRASVLLLIFLWIFGGWPQIFNFPPKVKMAQATIETFTTAGTFTNGWIAPAGVTSVAAETWGGGGGSGGGTSTSLPGGSGGGGGAYAKKVISVTPGNSYTYVVGAAGLKDGGTAGGSSSFTGDASVQSLACGGTSGAVNGGTAGAGGTIACSDGTAEFAGGAGAAGAGTSGGGGGESAGTTATGGNASGTTGGTGTDGTDGSDGQLVGVNGVAGNNPGAGAGGSGRRSGGSELGASGGVGQVRLTYVPPTVTTQSASSVTATTATLNGNITATGDANATVRGFAWGTNSGLSGGDTATTTENGSFGTGAFTDTSLTLVCNTTYYSRAYATNTGGTGLGAISASFTTSACPASLTFVISTDVFPNITPNSPVFATSTLSVNTDNSAGWNVILSGDDVASGGGTCDLDTDASVNLTDLTPQWINPAATTTAGNAATITSGDNVLAFRVMTASGTAAFRASSWWGATDGYPGASLWAGIASSTVSRKIGNSSISSGGSAKLNTVLYYLDVPATQKTGAYSCPLTFTATMN